MVARASFWARRLRGNRLSAIVRGGGDLRAHVGGHRAAQIGPFCGWNRAIWPVQCSGMMSVPTEVTVGFQELCGS